VTDVTLTLRGEDLPGRSCGGPPGTPAYDNIHVAVQRRAKPGELLGLTPGDAPDARWDLVCRARPARDGGTELTGPYVQGGPGERFVYLSWGTVADGGAFTMFRRAKVMLGAIDPDVLAAAVRSGRLTGTLGLTDAKGHPTCARVVPPAVRWAAG
jgi:hypothetical protein